MVMMMVTVMMIMMMKMMMKMGTLIEANGEKGVKAAKRRGPKMPRNPQGDPERPKASQERCPKRPREAQGEPRELSGEAQGGPEKPREAPEKPRRGGVFEKGTGARAGAQVFRESGETWKRQR